MREASGRPPALRARAGGVRVAFEDCLLGHREEWVDDFVILRRNGGAVAYQLAVVVGRCGPGNRGGGTGRRSCRLYPAPAPDLPPARSARAPLRPRPPRTRTRQTAFGKAPRPGDACRPPRFGRGTRRGPGVDGSSLRLAEIWERPTPADLLARFDPVRLPREPTIFVPEPVA